MAVVFRATSTWADATADNTKVRMIPAAAVFLRDLVIDMSPNIVKKMPQLYLTLQPTHFGQVPQK